MSFFNYHISNATFSWFVNCKWLLMTTLLMSSSQLFAKELNLATAINLMTEQNPSLKIFDLKERTLDAARYTAALNPEFQIALEAENFSGSKSFKGLEQSELTVSISSVLELGGKKEARTNHALKQYELLNIQRKIKSLDLISELTDVFIDTLATQERIKLAIESVRLSQDIYHSIKQKAALGAIGDAEVSRAYASLKQAKLTLQAEQSKFDRQRVKLSLYWAEKQPQFNHLVGDLFDFRTTKEIGLLFENLEQSNLIKVLSTNQTLAESRVKMIQADAKTNVNWSLGLRRIEANNDTALTAGLSVPLFNTTRNKGALIEAETAVDAFNSKQRIELLNLYGQVNDIYSLRTTAIERFKVLEKEIIPALSHALKQTQDAYLDGRYGYLEYSAARADLIQAKKSLIDTAQDILKHGIQLERIITAPIYNEPQHTQGEGGES